MYAERFRILFKILLTAFQASERLVKCLSQHYQGPKGSNPWLDYSPWKLLEYTMFSPLSKIVLVMNSISF